jgi:membrane-associated phospholipid phosphatase
MKMIRKRLASTVLALALLLGTAAAYADNDRNEHLGQAKHYDARLPIEWNQRVNDISYAEDQWFTFKGVRAHAMMHLAMHDTLNTIEPLYRRYAYFVDHPDPRKIDPIAAAATAAFEVLADQYPNERANLEQLRDEWLARAHGRQSRERGIALGQAAAAAILAQREGDNWDAAVSYTFQPPAPGVYQTYPPFGTPPGPGFVFGAGFELATPFTMTSQNQFRSGPPPDISSVAYAAAVNEVKDLGALNSLSRTADQTHAAVWWKEFTEGSMNRLARQLARAEDLNLWKATRMFAQLNMNMFDGYVNTIEAKFHYNFWRPVTAIHEAATDGNPDTSADVNWANLDQFTPPHPSYSSAHATVCATSLTVFGHTFGDDYSFTMETASAPPGGPRTRSFTSFSSAALEAGLSRVYLGYHFPFDSEAGFAAGTAVSNHAAANYLQPR